MNMIIPQLHIAEFAGNQLHKLAVQPNQQSILNFFNNYTCILAIE